MATLQTIRDRAGWLVAIAVGIGLLGFVFGDSINPGSGKAQGGAVAKIGRTSIGAMEYMNREKSLRDFYQLNSGGQNLDAETERQIKEEVWRRLVRETILEESYEQLGIHVSPQELKAMITGDQAAGIGGNPSLSQPHPIIQQMFTNPENGQLNRAVMNNYFNALENPQFAQEKARWLFIEDEIVDEIMSDKYFNMVKKGIQPSSLEVEDYVTENGKSTDFAYISKPFTEVSDEEITVTDADLKAYYQKHKEQYKQNPSRTFQYVVFDVEPSEADVNNTEFAAQQSAIEFSRTETAEIPRFVSASSNVPFDTRYYTYDELPEIIRDSVYNADTETIFGPYRDEEAFKVARNFKVEMRPDSVRARHILLSLQVYQGNKTYMNELADSLVTAIEGGSNFNQIALEFSSDESNRAIGGDLGWFGEGLMVTEFNDPCFEHQKGDLFTADTPFGIHIIRLEERSAPVKKVQVATIVNNIYASDETVQDYFSRALKFKSKSNNLESFTEQAREFGLDPRFAPNITKDQQTIPGIGEPSAILRWAYSAEANEVSRIFEQSGDDQYIIAVLTDVREDGYASPEQVEAEISLAVKKEKKAEALVSRLNEQLAGVTDLNQYGASNNDNVGEATQVQFNNTYVSGIGLEPYIVGASLYQPVGQISRPLVGESGVFVLSVTNREEPPAIEAETASTRDRLKFSMESRGNYEAFNALVEAADVEDNRLTAL